MQSPRPGLKSTVLQEKLDLLVQSFRKTLYEDDETFLENMKEHQLAQDDIERYRHWEWPQGVGLFGIWKLFEQTRKTEYLDIVVEYFDRQMALGLPSKNINTCAPLLTLSYLYEHNPKPEYLKICSEWAEWIVNDLPKTKEGGFQHITSDSTNHQELWDDTLFMTVLFLANIGRIQDRQDYIEEAIYQFFLHTKYLADPLTGLWYHGWTFNGSHNFAKAFWGRGNCWITMAIPLLIDMVKPQDSVRTFLQTTLQRQIDSLKKLQHENGMWHTLLDDTSSYVEASASCGIAYGMMLASRMGLVDTSYQSCTIKALHPILECIDNSGVVHQVSYGTAMGRSSKEFYKNIPLQPMPYGQALAILLLMEMLTTL